MRSGDVRLKSAANGFVVQFSDPDIVDANKKDEKYEDPHVEMVFTKMSEVIKFLQDNLEKLLREDEYSSAFTKALKE